MENRLSEAQSRFQIWRPTSKTRHHSLVELKMALNGMTYCWSCNLWQSQVSITWCHPEIQVGKFTIIATILDSNMFYSTLNALINSRTSLRIANEFLVLLLYCIRNSEFLVPIFYGMPQSSAQVTTEWCSVRAEVTSKCQRAALWSWSNCHKAIHWWR